MHIPEDYRKLGKPIIIDDAGVRLDVYLATKYPFHTRNQWQQAIRSGKVRVNGNLRRPAQPLHEFDTIFYHSPAEQEPDVDRNIKCLWTREDLMAVYKPSGLPMHEGGVYRLNTFREVLRNTFGPEWFATHRLDRETSGIVLCARSREMRNDVSVLFRERDMQKTYLAIVFGCPTQDYFEADAPLGETSGEFQRTKQAVIPSGQPSQTSFQVLERRKKYTLLAVFPKTGRTHQIRVHAAYAGFPLVGDKKYCSDDSIYPEYLDQGFTPRVQDAALVERLCLHATALEFSLTGETLRTRVDCPMPIDMQEIWNQLE